MEYLLHLLILVTIFGILSIALDLPLGHTGLISVAQAAFYGVGAYSSSLAVMRLHWPFLAALALGIVLSAVASGVLSIASLRLHEDYYIIATFAFQMIAVGLMNNLVSITRGPLGIANIPGPTLFAWSPSSKVGFLMLSTLCLLVCCAVAHRISGSPFGRVLRAIREDDLYAQSVGKCPLRFRVTVLAMSAGMTAVGGSLYAHYMTYIDPTSFDIMTSILLISMVIVGGAGSRCGPLVGAALLVLLPEGLRFAGIPGNSTAQLQKLIYGILLIGILMFRPKGLIGDYRVGR